MKVKDVFKDHELNELSMIKPNALQLSKLICLYGDSVVHTSICQSFPLDQTYSVFRSEKVLVFLKAIISQISTCHFTEK